MERLREDQRMEERALLDDLKDDGPGRKKDDEAEMAKAEHRQDCQEMFRRRGRFAPRR